MLSLILWKSKMYVRLSNINLLYSKNAHTHIHTYIYIALVFLFKDSRFCLYSSSPTVQSFSLTLHLQHLDYIEHITDAQ